MHLSISTRAETGALKAFAALALLTLGCGGASTSSGEHTTPASTGPEEATPQATVDSRTVDSHTGDALPIASDDPEATALTEAFMARLTVWTRADGRRVLSRRCREGPVDCAERLAAFARLIVSSARTYDIDPFLLAALAMRESGLDPAALGRNREAGLVQLHPRGAGRDMRFVTDDDYRERCQSELDACQGPVLDRGASYLAEGIQACGGVRAGLGRFASGHCTERGVHPQRVLEERDHLRALAAGDR